MQEPAITKELIASHGFTPDEYAEVNAILGRAPNYTEMGIFSAISYARGINGLILVGDTC